MVGDRDVHDSTSIMGQQHQDEEQAARGGGHDEEVSCHELVHAWFARKVRHVREGGRGCRTMYFATVACETVAPSFNNSP